MQLLFKLRHFAALCCLFIFMAAVLTYAGADISATGQSETTGSETAETQETYPSETVPSETTLFAFSGISAELQKQPEAVNAAGVSASAPAPSTAASPEPAGQKEAEQPRGWIGTVTTDGLNFRESPEKADNIKGMLNAGQIVTVLSSSGEWYRIRSTDGTYGWVSSSYIEEGVTLASRGASSRGSIQAPASAGSAVAKTPAPVKSTPAKTPAPTSKPAPTPQPAAAPKPAPSAKPAAGSKNTSLGQQIVDYSQKYLGVKYVWGGESPSGFDCSGFTKYVYNHFGIRLNRVAADQAVQGVKVAKSDLIPGDLVFFDTNGTHSYINHVGIYMGGGNFIHAASGGKKVMIRELNTGFYKDKFMTARRVIK